MNERPENAIALPDNLWVECPMVGKLRRITSCAACVHHRGLTAPRFPGKPDLSFALQHQVACGYPIARRILEPEE